MRSNSKRRAAHGWAPLCAWATAVALLAFQGVGNAHATVVTTTTSLVDQTTTTLCDLTTTTLLSDCGNAIVEGKEECDDGNTDNTDGCDEKCQYTKKSTCGNDKIEDKEQCDDGNTASGDGCDANCNAEYCGDGIVNDDESSVSLSAVPRHESHGEQCDDGNNDDGDGCTSDCRVEYCGDGIVNDHHGDRHSEHEDEECDDGNTDDDDGCSANCQTETCGDGIVNGTEQCDDGNTVAGDGCGATCLAETCGDGVVTGIEQCDDGNTTSGDGCSSTCTIEIPVGACCTSSGCVGSVNSGDCDSLYGGTYSGDGTVCGNPGVCSTCANGLVEYGEGCDDGNTATGDGCDATCAVEFCWTCAAGDPSVCTPDNAKACDDGNECTLGDICTNGTCGGNPPVLPAACRWVMLGGDDQRVVQSRTRAGVTVVGDICGETTRFGENSELIGDLVATRKTGLASSIYTFATIDGDILTGGGSIMGKPNGVILPGLAVDTVAGGTIALQSGNPDNVLDARGGMDTDSRVGECQASIDSIDPAVSLIDGLPATDSIGDMQLLNNESRTITAGNPGGLNVIDIDRISTGNRTTIVLDGSGDPATTFILRVRRKISLRLQSELQLTNGTSPEHVLIYGKSFCRIGEDVVGGGTLLCPRGQITFVENTLWQGTLIAGRKLIDLKNHSELTRVPLLIGVP